jgi:hypothetical protein
VIQVLLGHAKLDTTARYTQVATNIIREVMSPPDRLTPLTPKGWTHRRHSRPYAASGSGGRGYLPRPWARLASRQPQSRFVPNSRYFRDLAAMYREVARQASDPHTVAPQLRSCCRHQKRADELAQWSESFARSPSSTASCE